MNIANKELDFAKDLALEAGKIMRKYFRSSLLSTEWKNDGTPLTVADTTINDLVIDKVKANFPANGVIGEEKSYNENSKLVWVVDPIDGTMPFTIGIPVSTFSLGLVNRSNGQSLLGVVYDPELDELYWATKSNGAFLNNEKLKTSKETRLKNTYLSIIGGNAQSDTGIEYSRGKWSDMAISSGAKPLSLYSQVYSAAKVATGQLVGSIFGYGSPWDSAAVSIIVEEAGGIVTDLKGKIRRFDEWGDGCILSANKDIHKILLDIIDKSSNL